MVTPVTETKKDCSESNKSKQAPEDSKAQDDAQAKEDAMFQALLNSQREILAKLDFGGSNSELQFVEGPDNLPLVSPHNSGEFNLCSSSDDYDYRYEQYHHPEPPRYHPYHQHQQQYHHQQAYQCQQPRPYTEFAHQDDVDVDVDGIGDDRFILEEIEIESGDDEKGPATFDIGVDPALRRRKRDMEQEMVQTIKKRRNGSHHGRKSTVYDNLLPDMDESSSSLDFASLHSTTEASLWKPRDPTSNKDSCDSESTLKTNNNPPTMEDTTNTKPEDHEDTKRPAPPRRSSRSLWKPRQRRSSEMSVEDKRSMWKPRKRRNSPNHDSATSLTMDDLDSSEQQQTHDKAFHVSITEGDIQRRCPSRTSSNDSAASVESLSSALQQSLGSTKSIQEWDKKMGLKKSHSKTMRQSAKSRQQLLAFLQKTEDNEKVPRTIPAADQQQEEEEKPMVVVEL